MASVMLQMTWGEGPRISELREHYDPFKGSGREYIWQDDAACGGIDPELFMVNRMGDPEVAHIKASQALRAHNLDKLERAKSVCEDCPVKRECLEDATSSDLHWSVRGGQTPTSLQGDKLRMSRGDIPISEASEYIEYTCRSGRHVGDGYRGKKPDRNGKLVNFCLGCRLEA